MQTLTAVILIIAGVAALIFYRERRKRFLIKTGAARRAYYDSDMG